MSDSPDIIRKSLSSSIGINLSIPIIRMHGFDHPVFWWSINVKNKTELLKKIRSFQSKNPKLKIFVM